MDLKETKKKVYSSKEHIIFFNLFNKNHTSLNMQNKCMYKLCITIYSVNFINVYFEVKINRLKFKRRNVKITGNYEAYKMKEDRNNITTFPYNKRYSKRKKRDWKTLLYSTLQRRRGNFAIAFGKGFNNARAIERIGRRNQIGQSTVDRQRRHQRFMQVDRWRRYRQHCAALL